MGQILRTLGILALLGAVCGCSGASPQLHRNQVVMAAADNDGDSPLKLVGERLFRETRFAQWFYANSGGVLTAPPKQGDPMVADLVTLQESIAGPYRGQSISCAQCHLVDQVMHLAGGGNRGYTDFARRSPVPNRGDGETQTVRNAPTMVASTFQSQNFLHHDGEFATPEDLVVATYTGRNLGWFPGDAATAISHIAQVLRADDGSFPTETALGGLSYRRLFAGDPTVPARFVIPAQYRMDIMTASDQDVFNGLVKLIVGYMGTLNFAVDAAGNYNGSPYDVFLHKNNFPLAPNPGETPADYTTRLAAAVNASTHPKFVSNADGSFKLSSQSFTFGAEELQGFQIFTGRGRCVQCHSAPEFTDHLFHNTGASQDEYDGVHGAGSFAKLTIPNFSDRNANPNLYLPNSDQYPHAQGIFRSIPTGANANLADLGVWNVFGNPSMPNPQAKMRPVLCQSFAVDCTQISDSDLLALAIGAVKTPTIRNLGQSEPYLHTGQMNTIEDVIAFYIKTTALAQTGNVRNADAKLQNVQITADDVEPLAAFLRSLNEDYD